VTVTAPSVAEHSFDERALALHPRVALRPEPFGALLYQYGTRRLVFLKHPDVVRVVESLADHPNVGETLVACDIDARRRPSFVAALQSLVESEMLHDRPG
jgi:putative mycofactocin binding protein MftB